MERRQNPRQPTPIHSPPFELFHPHNNGPIIPGLHCAAQFKSLLLNHLKISITSPNNCVVLKNNNIFLVENVIQTHNKNDVMIIGRQLPRAGRELYQYPMAASSLGIYVVNDCLGPLKCLPINTIRYKAMKVPIPNSTHEFAIIELLHSDTTN